MQEDLVVLKARGRRLVEEISRFSLCFALSDHYKVDGDKGGRRVASGIDISALKAGILGEKIRAGDEIEGEALACGFSAIYRPRVYYPSYVLGEMRAAMRRGEKPPAASPHYLPVSRLPSLPDGWRITFLFPVEKKAFDRPDFPAHVRDVLTRDYIRIPLLIPPGGEERRGRIRYRARVLQLDRESLRRLSGVGEESYEVYSARGLTYFLLPLEMELVEDDPSLRGSLFAEMVLPGEESGETVAEVMEDIVREAVEEVFAGCSRGERQDTKCYLPHTGFQAIRFRQRLFALVFDPVIVVYRAPRLLGLYMPCDLLRDLEESSALFEGFIMRFAAGLQEALGLSSPLQVEVAYDNRLPWAGKKGALRGPGFRMLEEEHPFLGPTLNWLRGVSP